MEQEEKKTTNYSSAAGVYATPVAIVVATLILSGAWVLGKRNEGGVQSVATNQAALSGATASTDIGNHHDATTVNNEEVTPSKGVVLNATWGSLGKQLIDSGAVDEEKFKSIYVARGQFTDEYRNLLLGDKNGKIKITKENAGFYLNLLWGLGLANKNEILEKGEMMDPRFGGAQNFASTGGWTVSKGNPMDHYSKHTILALTPAQQALVEKVSKGVYRPCCGNSTHFPDCNHGMAMLGLLELMASQGASEAEMWRAALTVNSYWFPDNYTTIATYMKSKGIAWKNVNPQEILGADYSSAQGYASVASKVTQPTQRQGSGGCGVDAGVPAPQPKQQVGCGI